MISRSSESGECIGSCYVLLIIFSFPSSKLSHAQAENGPLLASKMLGDLGTIFSLTSAEQYHMIYLQP